MPAAGTTTGTVLGVSGVNVPTASWSPPMTAPVVPEIVNQNPPVRAAARGSFSRRRCLNARWSPIPTPTAARSSATEARPQATLSARWLVFRSATSAVDWIVSWTSATSAWFVAIERPVTIAWSTVGRGISVRWNVKGTLAAASSIPDWSARWRSD